MKRKLMLATVVVATLLVLMIVCAAMVERQRALPVNAVQIRFLGTNNGGEVEIWATNATERQILLYPWTVEVKKGGAWTNYSTAPLNSDNFEVIAPHDEEHCHVGFPATLPTNEWRLKVMASEELQGAEKALPHAKQVLRSFINGKRGTTLVNPERHSYFGHRREFYGNEITNGISSTRPEWR